MATAPPLKHISLTLRVRRAIAVGWASSFQLGLVQLYITTNVSVTYCDSSSMIASAASRCHLKCYGRKQGLRPRILHCLCVVEFAAFALSVGCSSRAPTREVHFRAATTRRKIISFPSNSKFTWLYLRVLRLPPPHTHTQMASITYFLLTTSTTQRHCVSI